MSTIVSKSIYVGVDEVGRGPLIGSVVAAAVILPDEHGISGLTDSKKLSAKRRQTLEAEIFDKARDWCIAEASAAEIDQINILQATLLAMTRAVDGLNTNRALFSEVRIDGNKVPKPLQDIGRAYVKGDALYPEISAASILAKEYRDRQLIELDKLHPQYGFAQHKGYPTRSHLEAIQRYGILAEHRRSFRPVSAMI
jgi:ribonuclease HII